jgi:hypothetical protein
MQKLGTVGLIAALVFAGDGLAADLSVQPQAAHESALDLSAPDIRRIFTLEQINAVLARAIDPALEHIEVEALPLGDLPLEDRSATATETIASTVVWLLFGPRVNPTPDATDPQRPAPTLQALHHAAFDPP